MSKTGKVGTFGGQDIPTVTIYMDGFVAGVRYYDQKNNAHVTALGWTPKAGRAAASYAGTGEFTNDFTNQSLGKSVTQTLIAQGADVIFPVAGSVGLGAAAAVQAANPAGGKDTMEWVDTDGCVSAPQYCSLFLTSVTKGIVTSVKNAVLAAAEGPSRAALQRNAVQRRRLPVALPRLHEQDPDSRASRRSPPSRRGSKDGSISTDATSYPAG